MRNLLMPGTARRGLKVLAFNTILALAISLFDGRPLWTNLVYAQCIGLCIWAGIELSGHRLADMNQLNSYPWLLVVPLAVVLGYGVGHTVADLLQGQSPLAYWQQMPGSAWGMLLVSLVASTVLTWMFVSHERLLQERNRAETAQRQATEAQLQMLQAQLEPHMLFNTLANLRALIGVDTARAQSMLDHLIAYLRATLTASRSSSQSLAQEFSRLQDYLELMAVRMGPRLQFRLELPESLRGHPIPPLLLQPLVENSIQHGLEHKLQGGSIHVAARAEAGHLVLSVQDTGLGLPQEGLPAAIAGTGFGLHQVRERLHSTYGGQGKLSLQSCATGGMVATVTLPLQL